MTAFCTVAWNSCENCHGNSLSCSIVALDCMWGLSLYVSDVCDGCVYFCDWFVCLCWAMYVMGM